MKISGCPLGAHLSRVADDPSAAGVSAAAEGQWRAISDALSPIVGTKGVEALHRRSVFLARAQYPWLPEPIHDDSLPSAWRSLQEAFATRSGADAAAAQLMLLQTFNDLLENLIGSSLTDRLLGPVWQSPPAPRGDEDDVS